MRNFGCVYVPFVLEPPSEARREMLAWSFARGVHYTPRMYYLEKEKAMYEERRESTVLRLEEAEAGGVIVRITSRIYPYPEARFRLTESDVRAIATISYELPPDIHQDVKRLDLYHGYLRIRRESDGFRLRHDNPDWPAIREALKTWLEAREVRTYRLEVKVPVSVRCTASELAAVRRRVVNAAADAMVYSQDTVGVHSISSEVVS